MVSRKKLLEKKKSLDMIAEDRCGSPELKSLIISNEDGPSINWEKVAELKHRATGMLIDLEILSLGTKGNYELVQNGRSMNPYCPLHAYFRKKQDALAFREALECEAISDEEKLEISTFPIKLVRYLE